VELRKLEKALKEDLAEGKEFSKEKREQYRKNRQNLEEKVAQLKKRIKKFAENIEKEYRLLKKPISKRVQEFLKEMESAINSMQERLKRKRTTDKTLSIIQILNLW
jgi:gas vesicle protein